MVVLAPVRVLRFGTMGRYLYVRRKRAHAVIVVSTVRSAGLSFLQKYFTKGVMVGSVKG
jgi:hypothetical protein